MTFADMMGLIFILAALLMFVAVPAIAINDWLETRKWRKAESAKYDAKYGHLRATNNRG